MIAKTLKENINETKPKVNETSVSVPTDKTQSKGMFDIYSLVSSTMFDVYDLLDMFKRAYVIPFSIDDDEDEEDD